jgi:hypothetical protein
MERIMPKEIWRPAPGFSNIYIVSNKGRVRNLCPPRGNGLVFGFVDRYGYRVVNLSRGGEKLKRKTHRLVCEAFHGPCPAKHECAHLDGDKANNRAENLKWVTRSENGRHKALHGYVCLGHRNGGCPGSANAWAKLTDEQVLAIRERAKVGASGRSLAIEYGLTSANMSAVIRGASYRNVAESDAHNKDRS